MKLSRWIRIYIIPAAVCQSVIVGGGYGTGREVVEFISQNGPVGGMAGLLVYAAVASIVLALSFEFARSFRVYDYQHFFRSLIGRGWMLYELFVIAGLLLILAVTGSAAASILNDGFGIPRLYGVGLVLLAVTALNYYGRQVVESSLTLWAVFLNAVFIFYAVFVLSHQYEPIISSFTHSELQPGWFSGGLRYSLNNTALIPLLLYATHAIETRRQAIISSLIASLTITVPGLLFHLSFMADYPRVLDQELPTYWMIQNLALPGFTGIYVVVLFGTIAQTGVGILQGLNERLDAWALEARGRILTRPLHATIAGAALLISLLLANLGITTLVAQGYGNAAWISLLIFQLPLCSIGLYKIIDYWRHTGERSNT